MEKKVIYADKCVFLIFMLDFMKVSFCCWNFEESIRSLFERTLNLSPFRSHRRRSALQAVAQEHPRRRKDVAPQKGRYNKKSFTFHSRLIAAGWPTPKLAQLTHENKYTNTMRGHHWKRKRREFFHV